MGVIRHMNSYGCRMFGISRVEAIGKNISLCMPQPFADMHDEYMRRYITSGHGRVVDSTRVVLGRHVSGHIFPMVMQVRHDAGSSGEAGFVGICREITTDTQHVLVVGREFLVTGCSRRVYEWCNVTPAVIEEEDVFIQDLIEGWDELEYQLVNKGEIPVRMKRYRGGAQQAAAAAVAYINGSGQANGTGSGGSGSEAAPTSNWSGQVDSVASSSVPTTTPNPRRLDAEVGEYGMSKRRSMRSYAPAGSTETAKYASAKLKSIVIPGHNTPIYIVSLQPVSELSSAAMQARYNTTTHQKRASLQLSIQGALAPAVSERPRAGRTAQPSVQPRLSEALPGQADDLSISGQSPMDTPQEPKHAHFDGHSVRTFDGGDDGGLMARPSYKMSHHDLGSVQSDRRSVAHRLVGRLRKAMTTGRQSMLPELRALQRAGVLLTLCKQSNQSHADHRLLWPPHDIDARFLIRTCLLFLVYIHLSPTAAIILIIVTSATTIAEANQYKNDVDFVHAASSRQEHLVSLLRHVYYLELSARSLLLGKFTDTEPVFDALMGAVVGTGNQFGLAHQHIIDQYSSSGLLNDEPLNLVVFESAPPGSEPNFPVTMGLPLPIPMRARYLETTLFKAGHELAAQARRLGELTVPGFGADTQPELWRAHFLLIYTILYNIHPNRGYKDCFAVRTNVQLQQSEAIVRSSAEAVELNAFILTLAVCGFLLIISGLYLLPLICRIDQHRDRVMKVFLSIPKPVVSKLQFVSLKRQKTFLRLMVCDELTIIRQRCDHSGRGVCT